MRRYDVIIVGAGPSGIFAAFELLELGIGEILMLEKGPDLEKRGCPERNTGAACQNCQICHLLSGWGGAGAFSDGKLTLSTRVGGFLNEYLNLEDLQTYINHVDEIFLDFGAPEQKHGLNEEALAGLQKKSAAAGLEFIPSPIRHMGTDGSHRVVSRMKKALEKSVDIRFGCKVEEILLEEGRATGVRVEGGLVFYASCIILAPGRAGVEWLSREGRRLGLRSGNNPVDIGVRVEVPADILKPLTDVAYEAKLHYRSKQFKDAVRTFCMCPYGEVVRESIDGVHTVNGQSYRERRTENSNFALLVSTTFTEPFKDPLSYGRYVARLANMLSGDILLQRWGDLTDGRRSTNERIKHNALQPTLLSAAPGDLSFALPYRHLCDIKEMIEALDHVAPGVSNPGTLLYGIETKFYSIRLFLSPEMETEIPCLYAVGDGAGVSRSLVQAASSGIIAARNIARRLKETNR